jgi:hypothetical protein
MIHPSVVVSRTYRNIRPYVAVEKNIYIQCAKYEWKNIQINPEVYLP